MARKTPTVPGRGVELLPGVSSPLITLATYRAQAIAARYRLPLQSAAIIAAAYFMEAR